MSVLLTAIATLGVIGAGSAGILYMVSQKFKVDEDPRTQEVLKHFLLPTVVLRLSGCAAFAAACVEAESLEDLTAGWRSGYDGSRSLYFGTNSI